MPRARASTDERRRAIAASVFNGFRGFLGGRFLLEGGGVVTPKQERFVQEYLIDLNATQAAIRAGYSKKTANVIGRQNLIKLSDPIEKAISERAERSQITSDRVLQELARIAFVDLRKVFRWGPDGVTLLPSDELTEDEAAIVAEVSETTTESGGSIKGKRFDKLKALELLGKHLGMFTDKVQMDVTLSPAAILSELERRRG
jgi:phage terminase small subunit